MSHFNFKNRIGEKHITNEGYTIEIIECFGNKNCTIQFENKFIVKNIRYVNIVRREIKNLFHKSVYGVGYIGIGKYSKINHPKAYTTWTNMLKRCYNKKAKEKKITYKDITVCDYWHNSQNFVEWFEKNWKFYMDKNWHLDKDILLKGNKIYSPETCCFVPQEINMLFVKRNSSRGKHPIGVYKARNKFQSCIGISGKTIGLGSFNTPEEAFQSYKSTKEKHIKEVAEKYKNQITEQTYRALINYQVEITD